MRTTTDKLIGDVNQLSMMQASIDAGTFDRDYGTKGAQLVLEMCKDHMILARRELQAFTGESIDLLEEVN